MRFAEHQQAARRQTAWLLMAFALTVAVLVAVINAALAIAWGFAWGFWRNPRRWQARH